MPRLALKFEAASLDLLLPPCQLLSPLARTGLAMCGPLAASKAAKRPRRGAGHGLTRARAR